MFTLFLGLRVDSIAERRAHRHKLEDLVNNRCFICDLSKMDFENAKLDYQSHVSEKHNPMAYLFYLMWVTDLPENSS